MTVNYKLVHRSDPSPKLVKFNRHSINHHIQAFLSKSLIRRRKTRDLSLSRKGAKQSLKSHIGFSHRTAILWTLFCPFHDSIHKSQREWELVIYMQHIHLICNSICFHTYYWCVAWVTSNHNVLGVYIILIY